MHLKQPLSAKELEASDVPDSYQSHDYFFLPLALLIGITIGTFVFMGSPVFVGDLGRRLCQLRYWHSFVVCV